MHLQRVINKLKGSAFLSKIGTVMVGTVLAQLILIGSVAFFTRFYSVGQFGELSFFMLIGIFGTQLFCWRYEFGIGAANKEKDAIGLLALCSIVSLISAMVFTIALILLADFFLKTNGFEILKYVFWFVIYAYSSAMWNAFSYYNVRTSRFKQNSYANVLRAVFTVGLSALFILMPSFNGLVVALAIAQLIATLFIAWSAIRQMSFSFFTADFFAAKALMITAKANKKLLAFSLPSALVEILSGQLPQLFIGSFGKIVFGWFGQANRLMNAPLDLIGQSVRSVFWESAGNQYRNTGNCKQIFSATVKSLFLLSIIPFIAVFFLAPWLFTVILGQEWVQAGHYAQILLPLCFFRFISNPVSSLFYITHNQKIDFIIQGCTLALIFLVFFSHLFVLKTPEMALIAYSMVYSLKYLVELFFAAKFSLGSSIKNKG